MTAYTATLRRLVIGDGTSYLWQREPSGIGAGRYRTSRLDLQWTDGNRALGPDLLDARTVIFDVEIWDGRTYAAGGTAAVEDLADDLKAAWGPVALGTIPLTLEIASGARLLNGRPVGVEIDLDGALFGRGRALLTFEASDPRLYAAGAASSITLGLVAGGGMTFPLTFPLTFGTGSDSDKSAVNAGNTDTPWVATITGPVNTPRLTLGETGEFLELDGDIPTGSTLVIDSAAQSILLNGSPRQSWQTLLSRWWSLAPGTNTVRYRAASGTGSCSFTWRSAWL